MMKKTIRFFEVFFLDLKKYNLSQYYCIVKNLISSRLSKSVKIGRYQKLSKN